MSSDHVSTLSQREAAHIGFYLLQWLADLGTRGRRRQAESKGMLSVYLCSDLRHFWRQTPESRPHLHAINPKSESQVRPIFMLMWSWLWCLFPSVAYVRTHTHNPASCVFKQAGPMVPKRGGSHVQTHLRPVAIQNNRPAYFFLRCSALPILDFDYFSIISILVEMENWGDPIAQLSQRLRPYINRKHPISIIPPVIHFPLSLPSP